MITKGLSNYFQEPLVDEVGNILIKEPTFLDKIEEAGKGDVVCTAV